MNEECKLMLRQQNPPQLCLDQVRKILHISKRKASWLLNSGIIPCSNNGKKTHQYRVDINDLISYMERIESDDLIQTPQEMSYTRNHIEFKEWLAYQWKTSKQILTVREAADLTGYSSQTINRWIDKDKLKSLTVQNKRVTTKEWLIEYYCTEGDKCREKSSKHISLLKKFNKAT